MGLLTLGSTHAPSFDDPIAMLLACHDKMRRFCSELTLLPPYLAKHGWNQTAQNSVQRIQRYFDTAAPLHHLDEEVDLFPAYAQVAPASDLQLLNELLAHHRQLEHTWQQLQQHLNTQPTHLDSASIHAFVKAYTSHMLLEEALFQRAQHRLQDALLRQLGQNMANRRK